ncbi:MAG: hypothetical protein AABZ39_19285 [Spirochaetota bacterium]
MLRPIVIILLIAPLCARNIVVFQAQSYGLKPDQRYITYAFSDIVRKDLMLFSTLNENPDHETNRSFDAVKRNVQHLAAKYNADVLVNTSISPFREDFVLRYFIYDRKNPYQWKEKTRSSRQEKFNKVITGFLEELYSTAHASRENTIPLDRFLPEEAYTPHIGYYQDMPVVAERDRLSSRYYANISFSTYRKFYEFYQENFLFNLDYCLALLENGEQKTAETLIASIARPLGEKHHYVKCLEAIHHYYRYRERVSQDDLTASIASIAQAIRVRNNFYTYHFWLSKLYFLQEDFQNAELTLEKVVELNPYHVPSYRGLIAILKDRGATNDNDLLIRYGSRVIEVEPDNNEMHDLVTGTYELMSSWSNAYISYARYNESIARQLRRVTSGGFTNARAYNNLSIRSKAVSKKTAYARAMFLQTKR